jgi:hypothetical protein
VVDGRRLSLDGAGDGTVSGPVATGSVAGSCGAIEDVSERFLKAAEERGFLGTAADGHWWVSTVYRNPMTLRQHRYIATACRCHYRDVRVLRELLAGSDGDDADSTLLRTPAGWSPPRDLPGTATQRLRYVWTGTAHLMASTDRPAPDALTMVTAGSAARRFVESGLVRAYLDTYEPEARVGLRERVRGFVAESLGQPDGDGGWRWWVAVCQGEPVGYAVCDLSGWDDVTVTPVAELIDQYIAPGAPRHCLPALMAEAASACGETVTTMLGKVQIRSPDPEAIYHRLLARGWQAAYDLWEIAPA